MSEPEGRRSKIGRVAHVLDDYGTYQLVINRGAEDGLKVGDRFLVYGLGGSITDPETGAPLGDLEIVRGRGQVVHLQERMATLRSIDKRTYGRTKRIIRENPFGAAVIGPRVIEEEIPAESEEQPFDHPQVGDYAKPI